MTKAGAFVSIGEHSLQLDCLNAAIEWTNLYVYEDAVLLSPHRNRTYRNPSRTWSRYQISRQIYWTNTYLVAIRRGMKRGETTALQSFHKRRKN